jgi:hypothetical protein
VKDEGTVLSYSELEHAPDEDLEALLRIDLGLEASECLFRQTDVSLDEVRACVTAFIEDYLVDGNDEAYETSVGMVGPYEESGSSALPPIVIWRDDQGEAHLLDGHKRLAAAQHVGLERLPAYEFIR